jgi:hypothetical protein
LDPTLAQHARYRILTLHMHLFVINENQISMIESNAIPIYVKILLGVFALVNIVYGIVGYFQPSHTFENSSEGVDIKGKGARYAAYEYSSRNVAMGIGLLIAAAIGNPQAIVMVTTIRALVEIQSMAINIALKKINEGFITAAVFLAIELFIIVKMFV